MILIVSFLGPSKPSLFSKDIFSNINKKNFYHIDAIIKKFNFCKKIYFLCRKKDFDKNIKFKNKKKVNFIFRRGTKNQIQSILKLKNKISYDEKVLILNPDSSFDLNFIKFERLGDGAIFNITKKDIRRNFGGKDTIVTNKKNLITKINKKSQYPFQNKVSAGLYFLRKWSNFIIASSKIKNLNSKSIHVVDIFIKLIKNKKIRAVEVKNFICFENDMKIKEYLFWKKYFTENYNKKDNLKRIDIQNIIPSAGEGSRHKKLGYNFPKPLIPVSGKKMYERSIESLPNCKNNLFIFRRKTFSKFKLKKKFPKTKKKSIFYLISKKTKGMAITIKNASQLIQLDKPVLVSSCDIKCVINYKKFYSTIKKYNPDAMIFSWSQYPFASESPNSHAYVKDRKSLINKISEKKTISNNPDTDSAVTGIFYFKSGRVLLDCIDHSITNKITVNGEYYIATAMTKLLYEKKKIVNFKVDQLISWSLPEHLMDYIFWEEKFKYEKG